MGFKTKSTKKMTKYQNILRKTANVAMNNSPSNTVVICNGGLTSGINQEMVLEVFHKYGEIENVIMIPGKSYSFVTFKNVSDATKAYDRLHEEIVWSQINGPLYLGYVEQLPETVLVKMNFSTKPSGLILLEDFVTAEEENMILACVNLNSNISHEESKSAELKHRKVKHYGYEFKYSKNGVDLDEPIERIPEDLDFLWQRLKNFSSEYSFDIYFKPDQLTVNLYEAGQGIPPHVDTHSAFEDGIMSLSLGSSIVMEFKHLNGDTCHVILPRRSLCIMSGESRYAGVNWQPSGWEEIQYCFKTISDALQALNLWRCLDEHIPCSCPVYDWTHGITPRKSDVVPCSSGGLTISQRETRTSLTFRKTRQGECACKFVSLCDSYKKKISTEDAKDNELLVEEVASKLEESYVHEVYEQIATHFSETRHKPWPNVVKFLKSFSAGSLLADIGCGNGKYLGELEERFLIGCDCSFGLLEVCRQRGFENFAANCVNIPLRDNSVDGCISIAVIHHLATLERRKKAVGEMVRILKPGGRGLIYVWAKNQERKNQKSSYLKQAGKRNHQEIAESFRVEEVETGVTLPVHTNRTNFHFNDLLVPWKLKPLDKSLAKDQPPTFLRFYHVFEENELRDLCSSFCSLKVEDCYYDQGNWCIIFEKI